MCEYSGYFGEEFQELDIASLSGRDLAASLSLDDVERFLYSLGVGQIEKYNSYLICPTICHNPIDDDASMKLYYYNDSHCFHCYTECSENFNIIELYCRYMRINHYEISWLEAEDFIRGFISNFSNQRYVHQQVVIKDAHEKISYIELSAYNPNVLSTFTYFNSPMWEREHITEEAQEKFDIRWSIVQNKVILPHYDVHGNLVGIRGRSFNEEDIAKGKYRPVIVGKTEYSHRLGFNLYGIYEHQDAIRRLKSAIIYEGEKSVQKDDVFNGEYSNAVACCGSAINRFQINLLLQLGVNSITIAFDKEYERPFDEKGRAYREKIEKIAKKYCGLTNFYYVFDEHGLLEKKDAPCDKGEKIYRELMNKKIRVE